MNQGGEVFLFLLLTSICFSKNFVALTNEIEFSDERSIVLPMNLGVDRFFMEIQIGNHEVAPVDENLIRYGAFLALKYIRDDLKKKNIHVKSRHFFVPSAKYYMASVPHEFLSDRRFFDKNPVIGRHISNKYLGAIILVSHDEDYVGTDFGDKTFLLTIIHEFAHHIFQTYSLHEYIDLDQESYIRMVVGGGYSKEFNFSFMTVEYGK